MDKYKDKRKTTFDGFMTFTKSIYLINKLINLNDLNLSKNDTIRLHLNIGKKQGLGAQNILGLINEKIKQRDVFIGKIEIMKSLRTLVSNSASPKSALVAIHDINIAARFSDRILLLHDGQIISQGTPQEVLTTENIAKVFGVTSEVEIYSPSETREVEAYSPSVRVIVKDEIPDDTSLSEKSKSKFDADLSKSEEDPIKGE